MDEFRGLWSRLPVALRLTLPIVLVLLLALVGIGFYVWSEPLRDDWARLPQRLNCQVEAGPKPPQNITVSKVTVSHPRDSVLRLLIRFAETLPPPPTGSATSGFVGYQLTYSIANNGKKFAELSPQEDPDDLAIRSVAAGNIAEANLRANRDTHAHLDAADNVDVYLDLKRFGVDTQSVMPEVSVASQFNTPSIVTVKYAKQICRAA